LDKLRENYYQRIAKAFEFLEEQVEKGRIQGYGISSNTFGAPANRADATCIRTVWELATDLAKKRKGDEKAHHFRIAQLPLNLYESGPFLEENTGDSTSPTPLDFAARHGIAVLANRPLNAFSHQHLIRL